MRSYEKELENTINDYIEKYYNDAESFDRIAEKINNEILNKHSELINSIMKNVKDYKNIRLFDGYFSPFFRYGYFRFNGDDLFNLMNP